MNSFEVIKVRRYRPIRFGFLTWYPVYGTDLKTFLVKTRPVLSVSPYQGRGISFERFPQPWQTLTEALTQFCCYSPGVRAPQRPLTPQRAASVAALRRVHAA